jgi:hypothetical protein
VRPAKPTGHLDRDPAVFHGFLAAGIVVLTLVSDSAVANGIGIGIACRVVATGWSWWRFRQRECRTAGRT